MGQITLTHHKVRGGVRRTPQCFLQEHKEAVLIWSAIYCLGSVLYWVLPSEQSVTAWILQYASSLGLGVTIGLFRTPSPGDRLRLVELFGIAWRITLLWGAIFAVVETVLTGDAVLTVTRFVSIGIFHIVFTSSGYWLGALSVRNIRRMQAVLSRTGRVAGRIYRVFASAPWDKIGKVIGVLMAVGTFFLALYEVLKPEGYDRTPVQKATDKLSDPVGIDSAVELVNSLANGDDQNDQLPSSSTEPQSSSSEEAPQSSAPSTTVGSGSGGGSGGGGGALRSGIQQDLR